MPSQTMEGSGTIVFQSPGGKLGNTTVPPTHTSTELNLFQSYDYETMNMAMRQLTNMTQGSIHLQTEVGVILNWKAGLMTKHMKSFFPNQKSEQGCKTIKLPFFLRFLPIGQIIKKVNLAMDADVDAAGLVKSLKLFEGTSTDITVNVNGRKETMHSETQILQEMTYSKSRAGGPSEEDLKVPAEWGDCSTVHEPNVEDLLAEWERSDSPFFGRTRIIPHTLRAMMAEATSSKIVV